MTEIKEKFSISAMLLLKSNLGYYNSEIPVDLEIYLENLLKYAYDDFAEMKIHLVPGVLKDDMDQMIHAAWMYRNGVNGEGKNEMLKAIIRNRHVHNAVSDGEGTV